MINFLNHRGEDLRMSRLCRLLARVINTLSASWRYTKCTLPARERGSLVQYVSMYTVLCDGGPATYRPDQTKPDSRSQSRP